MSQFLERVLSFFDRVTISPVDQTDFEIVTTDKRWRGGPLELKVQVRSGSSTAERVQYQRDFRKIWDEEIAVLDQRAEERTRRKYWLSKFHGRLLPHALVRSERELPE